MLLPRRGAHYPKSANFKKLSEHVQVNHKKNTIIGHQTNETHKKNNPKNNAGK